mmetsp:Transcript_21060/g.33903  ORF Transcript_21060/g.33903 Transcript_21060/m.33903 type:complete len:277 (-) Transcript_21060:49-879(-)
MEKASHALRGLQRRSELDSSTSLEGASSEVSSVAALVYTSSRTSDTSKYSRKRTDSMSSSSSSTKKKKMKPQQLPRQVQAVSNSLQNAVSPFTFTAAAPAMAPAVSITSLPGPQFRLPATISEYLQPYLTIIDQQERGRQQQEEMMERMRQQVQHQITIELLAQQHAVLQQQQQQQEQQRRWQQQESTHQLLSYGQQLQVPIPLQESQPILQQLLPNNHILSILSARQNQQWHQPQQQQLILQNLMLLQQSFGNERSGIQQPSSPSAQFYFPPPNS